MTRQQHAQPQQERNWHTDQRCQVCGAHLLLRDLVAGRAVHERRRGGYRTRCPEHAGEEGEDAEREIQAIEHQERI